MKLHIVILAAGNGTRMVSDTPKVMHEIGGKPMLRHVVQTAKQLNPAQIHVVVGSKSQKIIEEFADLKVNWVTQEQQLGTGHAVNTALCAIEDDACVLVLYADVPLIGIDTLKNLLNLVTNQSLALLVAQTNNPKGLGRVVRGNDNNIIAIVEERDASEKELLINEIYTGICAANKAYLDNWLPNLSSNNNQKEYYLTEIVSMAVKDNINVKAHCVDELIEVQGVNNRVELNLIERHWQEENAKRLMLEGVGILDSKRIDVRGNLLCAKDVVIDVNTVFSGDVRIGEGSVVSANCVLKDVVIGKNSTILANSVLEGCEIADNCTVGPFARIRPGTKLADNCKIGNFVEAKNITMAQNSKANHLTYLGDAIVGKNVNIGAGTITCNYDGAAKHQTVIEDNVFIGSGTELVAPVRVGEGSTIGAGSTIRKDVPKEGLTLSSTLQKTIKNWVRPRK